MDMSANRKYSASGPTSAAVGGPRQSPYRPNRQPNNIPYQQSSQQRSSSPPMSSSSSPRAPQTQRSMSPDEGLLPPPIPAVHHNRSTDSISNIDAAASRRLCAKCGQPMADKFVRAMGKKFHLDCFRCHVQPPNFVSVNRRNATFASPRNSFPSRNPARAWNTRYVKPTTFVASISYAPHVEPRSGGRTSLPSIKSTMSNILRVRFATPCLDPRIPTTNTREKYTVISTIARNSPFDVMGVNALFSNNSSKFRGMGRHSIGIPNVI
jgi:hypothetical protein